MKIIATVGTSLITNSENVDCSSLDGLPFFQDLFDGNNNSETKKQIKRIEDSLSQNLDNGIICAEIATLKKINGNEAANISLLCTETILSYLCGRTIKNYLGEKATVEIIPGLRITDADKFKNQGFFNLLKKIREIKQLSNEKVVLNISGGYKALIPPITLLAQLEKIPLYYIYEDSNELIETGSLPINFDWGIIEDLVDLLHNKNKREKPENKEGLEKMKALKLVESGSSELTIIGQMLKEYSVNASPFTATIFGYFIEYKIYEALAQHFGAENVEHSVKLSGMGSGDIDILIRLDSNALITIEIKPSYRLFEKEYLKDTVGKIIKRVSTISEDRNQEIKETWLMLYSYSSDKNDTFSLNSETEEILHSYGQQIKAELRENVLFKIVHIYIYANKLGTERHIYQKFMKTKVKYEDIKEVFSI